MRPQLPQWIRILVAVAIVLAALSAGTARSIATARPSAASPVSLQLALLTPLSGPAAFLGPSARDGALLAIQQQNAAGGVLGMPIAAQVEDTACDATLAVAAANKVITDGVRYIVGDVCSGSTRAVAEVTDAAGVIQISPTATHPLVTVDGTGKVRAYVFRAAFIDPFQGKIGAQFALHKLDAGRAFILYNPNNEYVKGLADSFEKAFGDGGGQVVAKEPYATGDTDFSAILAKIADYEPDVIYLPDFPSKVNLVTQQAKEKGITVPFVGGDGWDASDLDVQAADGGYFTTHVSMEDPRPEVGAFEQAFYAAYGRSPDVVAALAYDSARLLFQAMHEAGTVDTTAVKTKLADISFNGVTGSLIYDGYHNPIKPATIMHVDRAAGVHFYAMADPPSPALAVNYPNGSPGSYFAFTGTNFPAARTAAVSVNGHTIADALPIDDAGGLTFRLSTADADEGRYIVTASVNPKASAGFTLDAAAPQRPAEGSGPELPVPAGIAFTKTLYLPLVLR
jgi:branched-chain amino acid transport system substrate-binding protein